MNTPDFEAAIRAINERHDENISRLGWSIQYTHADPENNVPGFATTVGLTLQGLPEVIIFALPPQVFTTVLSAIARKMIGKTIDAVPGTVLEDIASSPMRFAMIEQEHGDYFGTVCRRWAVAKGLQPRYLLAVFADEAGHFPDEARCDPRVAAVQNASEIFLASTTRH